MFNLFFTELKTYQTKDGWVRFSTCYYPDKKGLKIGQLRASNDNAPFYFYPFCNLGYVLRQCYREQEKKSFFAAKENLTWFFNQKMGKKGEGW